MPFRSRSLLHLAGPIVALTAAVGCGEATSLDTDTDRCGANGASCNARGGDDPGESLSGDAKKRLRVFVSSTVHQGNLGGLEGADAACASTARNARVSGKWMAFISDSTTRAMDRVQGEGPWYMIDRKTLAYPDHASLEFEPRAPLDRDESNELYSPAYVWTGINPRYPSTSCSNWTSTTGTGTYDYAGGLYWNVVDSDCARVHSLICIEQR